MNGTPGDAAGLLGPAGPWSGRVWRRRLLPGPGSAASAALLCSAAVLCLWWRLWWRRLWRRRLRWRRPRLFRA
jgi:hypothetical protein